MGSQSDAIAEHIREERDVLARDIQQLESMVREEPSRWLQERLARIIAIAFAALFAIGFLTASRRRRY